MIKYNTFLLIAIFVVVIIFSAVHITQIVNGAPLPTNPTSKFIRIDNELMLDKTCVIAIQKFSNASSPENHSIIILSNGQSIYTGSDYNNVCKILGTN